MRGDDILERLLNPSVASIRVASRLPRTSGGRHIGLQLTRACTAAGANYQEGRHAQSRPDFIHKVSIAAKEVGETQYWLLLILRLNLVPNIEDVVQESRELTAILVASARTAKRRE